MTYTIYDRKKFPTSTGVYKISFKNSNSSKIYIGSATRSDNVYSANGFYGRWSKHIINLRKNNNKTNLQNAYNKYGEENMIFSIVEECIPEECIYKEQLYIDKYDSYNDGYNSRPIADNNRGFKHTEKHNSAISTKFKKIRDEKFKVVSELYNEGKTTREIAKTLDISRGQIAKMFKENKVDRKFLSSYTKKSLFQYSLSGEFIKEWDSGLECAKTLNVSTNSIRMVLKGESTNSCGFYFTRKKLNTEEITSLIANILKRNDKQKKAKGLIKYYDISQIDDAGFVIREWKTLSELILFLKIKNRQIIADVINSGVKYRGYYWNM